VILPIIDVDKAKTVLVNKRSMSPGFAGIENELYYADRILIVFGRHQRDRQVPHRRRRGPLSIPHALAETEPRFARVDATAQSQRVLERFHGILVT